MLFSECLFTTSFVVCHITLFPEKKGHDYQKWLSGVAGALIRRETLCISFTQTSETQKTSLKTKSFFPPPLTISAQHRSSSLATEKCLALCFLFCCPTRAEHTFPSISYSTCNCKGYCDRCGWAKALLLLCFSYRSKTRESGKFAEGYLCSWRGMEKKAVLCMWRALFPEWEGVYPDSFHEFLFQGYQPRKSSPTVVALVWRDCPPPLRGELFWKHLLGDMGEKVMRKSTMWQPFPSHPDLILEDGSHSLAELVINSS